MSTHGRGSLMEGIDHQGGGQPAKGGARKSAGEKRPLLMAVGLCAALLALAVFVVMQLSGGADAATTSSTRAVICAESNELFETFRVPEKGSFPYAHPKTGKATLYPAEACFWTKDGRAKLKPTWVLLNQYANKPGQTICPDCGKPVRAHNPLPPGELFPQN